MGAGLEALKARTKSRRLKGLAVLALAFLPRALADERPPRVKPPPFAWRSTFGDALKAASERSRPLIVYCPPVRTSDEPMVLSLAERALGSPPIVEGVRVGADEILKILERFKIKELPAVLLVDRRENVIHRWEGRIPPAFWSALEGEVRRLDKKDEEDSKVIREARLVGSAGDLEGAYRRVASLLASERTSPENLKGAEEIEKELLRAREHDLLCLLAREGIEADEGIRGQLEALRSLTSHPRIRADVEREVRRLERGTIGGRRR